MTRCNPLPERLPGWIYSSLVALACLGADARAGDWRIGGAIGLGGTGITSSPNVNGEKTLVPRSESPGIFSIYVDYLLSDRVGLTAEHIRGFRLGPFSSGVSFTGVGTRWYFLAPAPSTPKTSGTKTSILVKRLIPFVGLGAGVATGTISRDEDQAPTVSGSGVYLGFRGGVDYSLAPGWGLRPELTTLATFSSSTIPPSSVSEFGLQVGLYFYL